MADPLDPTEDPAMAVQGSAPDAPSLNDTVDQSYDQQAVRQALDTRQQLADNPATVAPILRQGMVNQQDEAKAVSRAVNQQNKQQAEADSQQSSQLAGTDRYLKSQGVQYRTNPDGSSEPDTHDNGDTVFKPATLNAAQWDDTQGAWTKSTRDDRGNVQTMDILKDGALGEDYHRDDGTGTLYAKMPGGQRQTLGVDQEFLDQKHQAQRLSLQQKALTGDEARLASMKEQLKSYSTGGMNPGDPDALPTQTKQVADDQIAVSDASTTSWPDFGAMVGGQSRASKAQAQLVMDQEVRQDNIKRISSDQDYAQLKKDHDTLAADVTQRRVNHANAVIDLAAQKYGLTQDSGDSVDQDRKQWRQTYGVGGTSASQPVVYPDAGVDTDENGVSTVKPEYLLDRGAQIAKHLGKSVTDGTAIALQEAKSQGYSIPESMQPEQKLYRVSPDGSIKTGTSDPVSAYSQAVRDGVMNPEAATAFARNLGTQATQVMQQPKDNGTGAAVDTASRVVLGASSMLDHAMSFAARFVGAHDLADNLSDSAKLIDNERTSKGTGLINESRSNTALGIAGDIGGTIAGFVPATLATEGIGTVGAAIGLGKLGVTLVGAIPAFLQMGGQKGDAAYEQAKSAGQSDSQAMNTGKAATLQAIPEIAAFMAGGAVAGKALKYLTPLQPILSTPFARGVASFGLNTAANVAAQGAIKGLQGENPFDQNRTDIASAAAFALHGSFDAAHQAGSTVLEGQSLRDKGLNLGTAQSIVTGDHPEIAALDGIAKTGPTPELRQAAAQQSAQIQKNAKDWLTKFGAQPAVQHAAAASALEANEANPDTAAKRDQDQRAMARANTSLNRMVGPQQDFRDQVARELIPLSNNGGLPAARQFGTPDPVDAKGQNNDSRAAIVTAIGQAAVKNGAVTEDVVNRLRDTLEASNVPQDNHEAVLNHAIGSAVLGDSIPQILRGQGDRVKSGYIGTLGEQGVISFGADGNWKLEQPFAALMPKDTRASLAKNPNAQISVSNDGSYDAMSQLVRDGHKAAGTTTRRLDLNARVAAASDEAINTPTHEQQAPQAPVQPDDMHDAFKNVGFAEPEPAKVEEPQQEPILDETSVETPVSEQAPAASTADAINSTEGLRHDGLTQGMDEAGNEFTGHQVTDSKAVDKDGYHATYTIPEGADVVQAVKANRDRFPTEAQPSPSQEQEDSVTEGAAVQPEGQAKAAVTREEMPAIAKESGLRYLGERGENYVVASKDGEQTEVPKSSTPDEARSALSRNGSEPLSDGGATFSKGEKSSFKTKASDVQKIADTLGKRMANKPDVKVIQGYDDLPETTREEYRKEGVKGFWQDGKVTLIAEAIKDAPDAAKVFAHEVIGHHGLREVVGKDYQEAMDKVTLESVGGVVDIAKKRGLDIRNPDQRREAAEEYVAKQAETSQNFLPKTVAWLKDALQKRFMGVKFQDDFVRGLLRDSVAHLRNGTPIRTADTLRGHADNRGDEVLSGNRSTSAGIGGPSDGGKGGAGDEQGSPEKRRVVADGRGAMARAKPALEALGFTIREANAHDRTGALLSDGGRWAATTKDGAVVVAPEFIKAGASNEEVSRYIGEEIIHAAQVSVLREEAKARHGDNANVMAYAVEKYKEITTQLKESDAGKDAIIRSAEMYAGQEANSEQKARLLQDGKERADLTMELARQLIQLRNDKGTTEMAKRSIYKPLQELGEWLTKSVKVLRNLAKDPKTASSLLDEQIKRVEDALKGIPEAKPFYKGEDSGGETRFSKADKEREEKREPFYSQLSRTVQSLPQDTMSVEQAKAAIEKGAKKDEVAMSGILTDPLSPLFGKKPGEKVTKSELTGYALEREAKVEDVTLAGPSKTYTVGDSGGWRSEPFKTREEAEGHLREAARENAENEPKFSLKKGDEKQQWVIKDEDGNELYKPENEADGEEWLSDNEFTGSGEHSWANYNDEGKYATLESEGTEEHEWDGYDDDNEWQKSFDSKEDADEWLEGKIAKDADAWERDMAIHETTNDDGAQFGEYQLPGGDEGSYREQFVMWPKDTGKLNWEDGHSQFSDIKNPIVRLRTNTRTDSEGKKTFFLEEIQGPSDTNQALMPPELRKRIYEIGMKRALREAVDQGADKIAWTTGEQQAERYSLENQVDNVRAFRRDDGTFDLSAKSKDGSGPHDFGNAMKPEKMEEYLGKELASRIAQQPEGWHTYEGQDLKVGGEGLKRLYDQTLPRIANELAKKFGVKVGTSKIDAPDPNANVRYGTNGPSVVDLENEMRIVSMHDTRKEAQAERDRLNHEVRPTATVHSLELPEALKAQQKQGNPLFSKAKDDEKERSTLGKAVDGLNGIMARLKETMPVRAVAEGVDDIKKVAAPQLRGGEDTANFARILQNANGEMHRSQMILQDALSGVQKGIEKLPADAKRAMLYALDENKSTGDNDQDKAMAFLKKTDNDRMAYNKQRMADLGLDHWKNFQNYDLKTVPHLFEDPEKAEKVIGKMIQGGTGFLKHRADMPLREIIEFAAKNGVELKPKSDNAVDMMMGRWDQQDRYFMAHQVFQDAEKSGYGHWESGDYLPKDGETRVDQNIGYKAAPDGKMRYFYMPEEGAKIINNYLSPGLKGKAWYDGYMKLGNAVNTFQLGFGAFHAGFVTADSMTSKLALALTQASRGDLGDAAKSVLGVPLAVITNAKRGKAMMDEYLNRGTGTPDIQKAVDMAVAGGGKFLNDPRYQSDFAKTMMDGFRSKTVLGGVKGVLSAPFALAEKVSHPIMDKLVPWVKLGVIYDLAHMELKKNPDMTPEEFRKASDLIVRSVDNRLGQMTYDNLHINKVAKDLLMASVRSVGWNIGTVRELGGGAADWAKQGKSLATGQQAIMTHRMAYTMALPLLAGSVGALMQYLATGKWPSEMKDYFYPKTGGLMPDGSPARVALPTYMKDVYAYAEHPIQTVEHKVHPLISMVASMLNNENYYGVKIRNEDDSWAKQMKDEVSFIGQQMAPFSVTGAKKMVQSGSSPAQVAASFVGVSPAPKSLTQSDAMKAASGYLAAKMGESRSRTQAEADKSEIHSKLIQGLRTKRDMAAVREAVASGKIKGREVRDIQRQASMTPLQARVQSLSLEQVQRVNEVATPQEQKELKPVIAYKLENQRKREGSESRVAVLPSGYRPFVPR